mmetsp:Transcript_15966/g.37344  ORF Transcript_15966/g.37344 Transcript_15966/m.37344 type:complete len:213 (-) Transcript_15966:410-1048(-)
MRKVRQPPENSLVWASHFTCTTPRPPDLRNEAPPRLSERPVGKIIILKVISVGQESSKGGDTATRSLPLSFLASTVQQMRRMPLVRQNIRSKVCGCSVADESATELLDTSPDLSRTWQSESAGASRELVSTAAAITALAALEEAAGTSAAEVGGWDSKAHSAKLSLAWPAAASSECPRCSAPSFGVASGAMSRTSGVGQGPGCAILRSSRHP